MLSSRSAGPAMPLKCSFTRESTAEEVEVAVGPKPDPCLFKVNATKICELSVAVPHRLPRKADF